MKGAPRSDQFDDIYFSVEDGLAETQYVFLEGNDLPHAWQDKSSFIIAETGFGTGLNFLSAWKLFDETAAPDQTLDFISVEKFPLSPERIFEALKMWSDHFGARLDILCENYPIRVNGFHRIKINSQITLTLIFDDVQAALSQLDATVDCWFLDGFTPSKNPDMWTPKVFEQMANLSHDETSFATFTAVGDVRRDLIAAGFDVVKRKGFKHKREMLVGKYSKGDRSSEIDNKSKKIAIIGGGLAGTSCAYVLKKYGYDVTLYEASDHLAAGASGNSTGFYNPRFTAQRDVISDFFAPAYAQFIRLAKYLGEVIDYNPCGALHLINTPEKQKRFDGLIDNWGWHEAHAKIIPAEEASNVAGLKLNDPALYLPDSGSVTPRKLCEFYAQDINVKLNTQVDDLTALDADIIILCNAASVKQFEFLEWLPLETVRGQVSVIKETANTKSIKANIHYGGYISANNNGTHVTGATFQKWKNDTDVIDEDHSRNIEILKKSLPLLQEDEITVQSGWAGLRTASQDRFPVVGVVPDEDNMYVSTAFGSHGLVGSLASAHYLADLIRNGPKSLPKDTLNALNPQRFIDRALKKGRDIRQNVLK